MKKEDISGIIVYLLILGIAVVFGLTVLQTHASDSELGNMYILFVIVSILVGLIFNALLFELAHILGAKLGRYEILSVNILGFMFYKENGKNKFKFSNFDGLTGETKILPKNEKKPSNPSFYLLFGTFFYAVEIIIIVLLFTIFNQPNDEGVRNVTLSNIGYFLLTVGVLGGMILIYNILPLKLDAMTDGYRLKMVSNPKNKEAFNELLRVEHEIAEGHTDVEIKTFTEITNFTADLNLNKVYLLLDKHEFDKAEELLDIILKDKNSVSYKVYLRARAQKIYINLMNTNIEEASKFYKNEISGEEVREISSDVSMASIRAYLLIAGLMDKSKSECIRTLNNVYKAFKHTPKKRQNIEMTLFNEAVDKVSELHPSWELDDYKLVAPNSK